MTDRILIRDLQVACIIGIYPKERLAKQMVILNLALECDLATAAASDAIADTVNYKELKDRIVGEVGVSEHLLIEKLAQHVASLCLVDSRVRAVTVTVDKPGALTGARSVAVEIRRTRG